MWPSRMRVVLCQVSVLFVCCVISQTLQFGWQPSRKIGDLIDVPTSSEPSPVSLSSEFGSTRKKNTIRALLCSAALQTAWPQTQPATRPCASTPRAAHVDRVQPLRICCTRPLSRPLCRLVCPHHLWRGTLRRVYCARGRPFRGRGARASFPRASGCVLAILSTCIPPLPIPSFPRHHYLLSPFYLPPPSLCRP